MLKKFIGDKAFYRWVLAIVLPIIVQNVITNFVALVDNLMVGQVGTEEMSGVAIANQIIFILYLSIFGIIAGVGIFGAQFFGKGDVDGFKDTFRLKLISALSVAVVGIATFLLFREPLVSLFLTGGDSGIDVAKTLKFGSDYILIMTLGFIPFTLVQIYASYLREAGETVLPMKAGIIAVITNTVLNYLLIFGNFGFPELGAIGAAVATVVARFVELSVILISVRRNKTKFYYFEGVYRKFKVPAALVRSVAKKGAPLFFNELVWSIAVSTLFGIYSMRGLSVVAAFNISNTVVNLFNVVSLSMGNAIGIIIGQLLGAGENDKARDSVRKLMFMSVMISASIALIEMFAAPFIPLLYNTTDEVKALATTFLWVAAVHLPLSAFTASCYFTLRSGGRTIITIIFDSVSLWVTSIPVAFVLVTFTSLPITWVYFTVLFCDLFKATLGLILVKKGIWVRNIVA